jgi:adenine-specific DNA-methyltransferase
MAEIKFKGKTFVQNHHLLVPYHELIPVKSKSLTDKVSLHDNLIIHGDNLKALKALLPMYAGKIKCIYIDPPYNTGNEKWAYNDNVNSPMMQDWLGKVVDREDLTRHDKWLCMMTPRLKLLRELLRDDGVIFVSIDENEQNHLRCIMSDIFSDNHVVTFVWAGRGGKGGTTGMVEMSHEYVECFTKKPGVEFKPVTSVTEEGKYRDEKGTYHRELLRQWGQGDRREDRPSMYFPILLKDGREVYPKRADGSEGRWRFGEATVRGLQDTGDLDFVEDKSGEVTAYRKIREGQKRMSAADSLLLDLGTAATGTIELKRLFNGQRPLETVKPTTLIGHLIDLATWDDKNAIVLDSFAGSGTTAHAVLNLNQQDGGNRCFILIECEDYANTVTAERVRRVIKGVPSAKDEQLKKGLGGTFSYFELGKPIELQGILDGSALPTYKNLARYVFYTATGEEFDDKAVNAEKHFIGESRNYQVYLFYEPKVEKLKNLAFTLDMAKALPKPKKDKRHLVFAPTKYLDQEMLDHFKIDFAQLPYEIYELTR